MITETSVVNRAASIFHSKLHRSRLLHSIENFIYINPRDLVESLDPNYLLSENNETVLTLRTQVWTIYTPCQDVVLELLISDRCREINLALRHLCNQRGIETLKILDPTPTILIEVKIASARVTAYVQVLEPARADGVSHSRVVTV